MIFFSSNLVKLDLDLDLDPDPDSYKVNADPQPWDRVSKIVRY